MQREIAEEDERGLNWRKSLMRIDKSRLNPLHHQYSNQENRLTHALLHTVTSSKWIFPQFMRQIANITEPIKRKNFEVTTQKVPFQHGDKDPVKIESIY